MSERNIATPVTEPLQSGADQRLEDSGLRAAGYLHPLYAQSLSESGQAVELPLCGGWLLGRPVPATSAVDATGVYPLFCCRNWALLGEDLRSIGGKFVSIVLVADPFGDHTELSLRAMFDYVVPFKPHFVADLEQPVEQFTSSSHRKFARQAQRQLQIEVCSDPVRELDAWCELYGQLVRRRGIAGIQRFSRFAFERQLRVPGLVMFRASHRGETVGLDLWYVQGAVAQGHLVAFSESGYELHAGYGLKLAIIEYFRNRVRWLNLGGAAGPNPQANDGLTAFKRGWASGTRMAWLCGRILNRRCYAALVRQRGIDPSTPYFPAYRSGEFL